MDTNLKKVITSLVLGAMVIVGGSIMLSMIPNTPNTLGKPITEEQAIEISKKSELLKRGLATAQGFAIEANYYNSSRLEQLKEWHSSSLFRDHSDEYFWEEKVPEGHTAWQVIWWLEYPMVRGGGRASYNVIIILDAEKAEIIQERIGIAMA